MQSSDELGEDGVTKPPLTGIPQIDYVWDPNLPRELNGYMMRVRISMHLIYLTNSNFTVSIYQRIHF